MALCSPDQSERQEQMSKHDVTVDRWPLLYNTKSLYLPNNNEDFPNYTQFSEQKQTTYNQLHYNYHMEWNIVYVEWNLVYVERNGTYFTWNGL